MRGRKCFEQSFSIQGSRRVIFSTVEVSRHQFQEYVLVLISQVARIGFATSLFIPVDVAVILLSLSTVIFIFSFHMSLRSSIIISFLSFLIVATVFAFFQLRPFGTGFSWAFHFVRGSFHDYSIDFLLLVTRILPRHFSALATAPEMTQHIFYVRSLIFLLRLLPESRSSIFVILVSIFCRNDNKSSICEVFLSSYAEISP